MSRLPDEVLNPIFEFLSTTGDKISACLVCRRWRGPGQRALFGDVNLSGFHGPWLKSPAAELKRRTRRLVFNALAPEIPDSKRVLDGCRKVVSLTLGWTTAGDNSLLHHPSLAHLHSLTVRSDSTTRAQSSLCPSVSRTWVSPAARATRMRSSRGSYSPQIQLSPLS